MPYQYPLQRVKWPGRGADLPPRCSANIVCG
jgi:hypothetical protein